MELMNVEEIAKLLRVSQNTVYSMVEKNEMPYIKVKGSYRFNPEEVIKHLSNQPKNKRG